MTNQTWLARVDQKTPNGYECDKEPGYYEEKDGWKVKKMALVFAFL